MSTENIHAQHKHGLSKHPVYNTWSNMIQRCSNPKHPSYADYGARGIQVCAEWLDFLCFWRDMSPSYSKGLTLDRRENDLGYFKRNCRWASRTVQNSNMRVRKDNSSGFRGVNRVGKRYRARVMDGRKTKHLGYFDCAEAAAQCAASARDDLWAAEILQADLAAMI